MRFWLGLRPRPRSGGYSSPPDFLAEVLRVLLIRGRKRGKREGEKRGK